MSLSFNYVNIHVILPYCSLFACIARPKETWNVLSSSCCLWWIALFKYSRLVGEVLPGNSFFCLFFWFLWGKAGYSRGTVELAITGQTWIGESWECEEWGYVTTFPVILQPVGSFYSYFLTSFSVLVVRQNEHLWMDKYVQTMASTFMPFYPQILGIQLGYT